MPAPSGLYYKPMTIVTDDPRIVTQLKTSLADDARVVIYDCIMFIVQATGRYKKRPKFRVEPFFIFFSSFIEEKNTRYR